VIEFLTGFEGDEYELGLLGFAFLKSVFELVELLGVVQANGSANDTFNDTTNQ
jgi:hypothetical protein